MNEEQIKEYLIENLSMEFVNLICIIPPASFVLCWEIWLFHR